jgi:hypothetical protein
VRPNPALSARVATLWRPTPFIVQDDACAFSLLRLLFLADLAEPRKRRRLPQDEDARTVASLEGADDASHGFDRDEVDRGCRIAVNGVVEMEDVKPLRDHEAVLRVGEVDEEGLGVDRERRIGLARRRSRAKVARAAHRPAHSLLLSRRAQHAAVGQTRFAEEGPPG